MSYVARTPLLGVEEKSCSLRELDFDDPVPVLSLAELAAGKLTALLSRGAARDYFDAWTLIEHESFSFETAEFRLAFLCQVASARTDLRETAEPQNLSKQEIERQMLPLLRARSTEAQIGAGKLMERLNDGVLPIVRKLIQWKEGERLFLHRLLDLGEIEPWHLTDDAKFQERISKQSMLLWKQMHLRKHLGLDME